MTKLNRYVGMKLGWNCYNMDAFGSFRAVPLWYQP